MQPGSGNEAQTKNLNWLCGSIRAMVRYDTNLSTRLKGQTAITSKAPNNDSNDECFGKVFGVRRQYYIHNLYTSGREHSNFSSYLMQLWAKARKQASVDGRVLRSSRSTSCRVLIPKVQN